MTPEPAAAPGRAAAAGGPGPASPGVAALLLGLGVLSALKGLTLVVDDTVAYLYYTDYRHGFVARGLLGQLFAPLLAAAPKGAHAGLLAAWHLAALAALLAATARLAARTVAAAGGRADVAAMAALLFCSPLFTSLANLTAAPEVPLCLLTLAIAAAIRAGRHAAAWVLFLAGALAHQLMLFLALPLMVLGTAVGLGPGRRRGLAVAGTLAAGLAAALAVLLAPAPDPRLAARFVEHGIPPEAARNLLADQLGQGTGRMLGVMAGLWRDHALNGLIAVAYGAGAGAAVLAACLLGSPGAVRSAAARLTVLPPGGARTALAVLLALGAGLGPLLVLALAFDLSRLAVLATFTSFLAADALLRPAVPAPAGAGPPPRPGSRPGRTAAALACGVLAAVFLWLPYVGLWFNGSLLKRGDLLVPSPALGVGASRAVVEAFLRFYDRDAP
jgi:hypothetical protein